MILRVLAAGLMVSGMGVCYGQSWTDPIPLTVPGENDSFLGPVIQDNGDIHVLNVNIDLGDFVLREIVYDADREQWSDPAVIAVPSSTVGAPDFVHESDGSITVLYRDTVGMTDQFVEVRYDAGSGLWSGPVVIFERTRPDSFSPPIFEAIELAQDELGAVVATIDETSKSGPADNLSALRRDPDSGAWTGPEPVVSGSQDVAIPTLVHRAGGGDVHLLYAVSNSAPGIRHRAWDAQSGAFGTETLIPGTSDVVFGFVGPSSQIPAVVDGAGRVTALWDTGGDFPSVRASWLAEGTWSSSGDLIDPIEDKEFDAVDFGDIVVDGEDNVRIVVSRSESEPGLFRVATYSVRYDATDGLWEDPELVTAEPILNNERKRIAFIDGGPEAVVTASAIVDPGDFRRQTSGFFFDGAAWSDVIDIPEEDLAFLQELAFNPANGRAVLIYEETSSQPDAGVKASFFIPPSCPADLTGPGGDGAPDGSLTSDDFFFYLGLFAAGDPRADLTGPGGDGVPDGSLTSDDFFFYLGLFAAGCP